MGGGGGWRCSRVSLRSASSLPRTPNIESPQFLHHQLHRPSQIMPPSIKLTNERPGELAVRIPDHPHRFEFLGAELGPDGSVDLGADPPVVHEREGCTAGGGVRERVRVLHFDADGV